ncbi:hypothetical protein ACLOJK_026335 [Asimina triloba]
MDNLDDIVFGHRFFASKAFNGGRNRNGEANALIPPRSPYFLHQNGRSLRNQLNDAATADERLAVKTQPDVMKQIVASVAKLKRKMPRMVFNYLNRRSDKGKGAIGGRSGLRPAGSGRKNSKEKLSSMFHHFFRDVKKPKMGSEREDKEATENGHGQDPEGKEIFNGFGLDDTWDRFEELSLSDLVIKEESSVDKEQMALKPVKKSKISPFHLLKMKSPTKKKDSGDDGSDSDSRYGGFREGFQKKVLRTRRFKPKGVGGGGGHERKAMKVSWKKERGLCEKPIMMGKRCQMLDLNSPSRKGGEGRKPFFVWEGEPSTIDEDMERKESNEEPRY